MTRLRTFQSWWPGHHPGFIMQSPVKKQSEQQQLTKWSKQPAVFRWTKTAESQLDGRPVMQINSCKTAFPSIQLGNSVWLAMPRINPFFAMKMQYTDGSLQFNNEFYCLKYDGKMMVLSIANIGWNVWRREFSFCLWTVQNIRWVARCCW